MVLPKETSQEEAEKVLRGLSDDPQVSGILPLVPFPQHIRRMDLVQQMDPEKHRRLTGVPNDNILDMLRFLSEIGKPVWIRQVLVPGWTDAPEDLLAERRFLDTLTNVRKVEVLPYHSLGAYKWKELGLEYPLKNVKPPTGQQVREAEKILRAGVEAEIA